MAHRRWTKKKQAIQAVVFGRNCSKGLWCKLSSLAAPRSRTELEKVQDGDERARTMVKMEDCCAIPRPFQTNLAPLEAAIKLRWCDRRLGFAVALSPCRGVARGVEVNDGNKGEGSFGYGERRENRFEKREKMSSEI